MLTFDERAPISAEPLRVLAVGAAHVDRRGRPSAEFRLHASNPGTMVERVGGSVLNAAVVMRIFGAEVAIVSARGGDADGALVAQALESAGIEDHSMTWLDRRTPGYTAMLDDRSDLVAGLADMALYDLLSPRVLSRSHLRREMAARTALILDANLPSASIVHLLTVFSGRPIAAIGVSPAKVVKFAKSLAAISMIFLSRAEAAALVEATPTTSMETLAQLLFEAGARQAVVTDGAADAAILDGGEVFLQSPPTVARLRDVTGAGDTLAAIAALQVFKGQSFIEGARRGMAAASRRVTLDGGLDAASIQAIDETLSAMTAPRRIA